MTVLVAKATKKVAAMRYFEWVGTAASFLMLYGIVFTF